MLLSVIIPVYNVEPYLRECLDSVFAQDLAGCEVVAVNDGSTDGSRAILEEYKEKSLGIMSIVDKPNGGLSSARNAGVRQAHGDYLYFLDSDDYLKSHAIATIKQIVWDGRDTDVFYLDCIVTSRGERLSRFPWETMGPIGFREFFDYTFRKGMGTAANAVSYVYSYSFWQAQGLHFEEGIKYEDSLFKYQVFVKEGMIKACHVDDPFYVYRIGREGSITTKRTLKNFEDRLYIRKQIAQLFVENDINDISFRNVLFNHGKTVLLEAYDSGFLNQRRLFWSKQDIKWMRQGVSNSKEYSLYLLARISPNWMARYAYNNLPKVVRRFTNFMLSLAVKLCYK